MVGLALCYTAAVPEESGAGLALVAGIAAWPGHDLSRAHVQLYRDAECTKLAYASRKVGREGSYAIIVPEPGIYYVRLHVDANGNGKPDSGDGIGFYGLKSPGELGQTPRQLTLVAGGVAVDVVIPVIATLDADGKPGPLQEGALPVHAPPMILGAVVWPEHDLRNARVRLFTDERLSKVAYESPPAEAGGSFAIVADPGTYYACVTVDVDGDGKFGPGDAVGYHGVTDMTDASQRPQPITIGPGHPTPHLVIPVSAVLTEGGKLQAVEVPESVSGAARPTAPSGRVSGTVVWPGHTLERAWVVAASSPRLRDIVAAAAPDATSGAYTLALPPGEYVVAALMDANGSGRLDAGDCIGFRGGETPVDPEALLNPIRVEAEQTTAAAQLHIVARLAEDGGVVPLAGEWRGGPVTKVDPAALPALVRGRVLWEGKALKQGATTFFRNKELSQVAAVVPLGPGGTLATVLPPGTYYLMGGADMDGDGAMSAGDGLGIYGAGRVGAADERKPVSLEAGALRAGLDVRISDVVAEDGTLSPLRP
ncbi:MAG: hypothetical protein ACE5JM_04070 [Armatimonadota bacterium]